jgi:hypothetical protein
MMSFLYELFSYTNTDPVVQVREIYNEDKLLAALFLDNPKSDLLEFEFADSETYQTITEWCNLETDLRPSLYENQETGLLQTTNSLFFDPNRKAFVSLNDDFHDAYVYANLSSIYPEAFWKSIQARIEDGSGTFVDELILPEHLLEKMEKTGVIGKRMSIDANFLTLGEP